MTQPQQPSDPQAYRPQDHDQPTSSGYGTNPYGEPGYGSAQGQMAPQGYGQPYPHAVGDHPQGTLILVFGVAGFFVGVLGPVAWIMGSRALKEIRATGAHPANEQQIVIGRILGIVVTILMVLGALFGIGLVLLAAFGAAAAGAR